MYISIYKPVLVYIELLWWADHKGLMRITIEKIDQRITLNQNKFNPEIHVSPREFCPNHS